VPYSDEDGYERKTEIEILEEKEDQARNIFETVNYSISDQMWQWLKIIALERQEIEMLHEIGSEMQSISEATGIFLDKWGEECGISRKGATRSEGYVEVTATISGSPFTLQEGTQFKNQTTTYETDEEVAVPYTITMTKTKTGESDDYFSSDIDSVGAIVKILDENNNEIPSTYYTLDSVYKNNVQWTESSSAVLVKDENYTVYVSGSVTKRVEVTSTVAGVETVATVGSVTSCLTYPSLNCTNTEEIDGGADVESDENFRTRLLNARRRTFTLGKIKDIVLGIDGVRSAKVFQTVGTDQTSVADWDNPSIVEYKRIYGINPILSQNFVPGDQIATLGKITIYGRPVNDPPALYIGVKPNVASVATGTAYFDFAKIEKYELDQSVTGWRDIPVNLKYNGMDKTKTYRFDIWCDDPENSSFDWVTNYWLVAITDEGYRGDSRGALLNNAGATGSVNWVATGALRDLMFKTSFNGAGYEIILSPEDGYGFNNLANQVETYLDYVGRSSNPGYSPVCIQYTITESTEILIDVKGVIYISDIANFQNVRREIIDSIEYYLENLTVGENVTYSRIFQTIMDHALVNKLEDLYIKRSTDSTWVQHDLGLLDTEIADLGARSFQSG
jgi:uncharacterized phage protein gp47/JayE